MGAHAPRGGGGVRGRRRGASDRELAVCAGSCGPGNLHLINGLFDCHRSRVPVLAIAAQIPSSEIGIDYFQATPPEVLFRECSHYVELVSNAKQLPQILGRAMRTAIATGRGRRGDPGRCRAADAGAEAPGLDRAGRAARAASEQELDRLATLVSGAADHALCGAGCAGAHAEVVALAAA